MLVNRRSYASRSWIRSTLRTESFPDDGEGSDDLSPDDLDIALDAIVGEVSRRRQQCPNSYPFSEGKLGGVVLERQPQSLAYLFLLFLCVSPSVRNAASFRKVDRTFDMVVLNALQSYLGEKSTGLRFGAPGSGGRPKKFGQALTWLSEHLGIPRGVGSARGHTGDGGVDVIVWLPFPDRLHAFITVLAQCTIQRNWYTKAHDISSDKWRGWIDFGVDPVTCLAVPFVVGEGDDRWDEIRRTATVVLERFRIAELAIDVPTELRRIMRKWLEKEISQLAA